MNLLSLLPRLMPVELAHDVAPIGLRLYADLFSGSDSKSKDFEWQPLVWRGLHFRNRLGIAGGVDKNADSLSVWPKLGAGFIEIGTITPRPQTPNDGKILARDYSAKNLWNKMGFPNAGAKDTAINLSRVPRTIPRLINIGKNRSTDLKTAATDYADCVRLLKSEADAFVINISSPNTQGLRELQSTNYLNQLCRVVIAEADPIPVLVKLSPDLSAMELRASIDVGRAAGISGFILTNTTTSRPQGNSFPKEGGLSGQDLAAQSKIALKTVVDHLGSRKEDLLVISVGGIMSAADIKERLNMGADLVQVYSALVFSGPHFFKSVAVEMRNQRPSQ